MTTNRIEPATGAAADRGPSPQGLAALCGAGVLVFNFPLLMVWDADVSVLGLPLLPVALFALWAALIAALAFASERGGRAPGLRPLPPGDDA
ncbi:hypothetical protein ABLE93_03165 [Xanthobacter sp. KR7-65]|uniref:hypothetical protein n=1 Tax=Xanthobacter sp. KR7-65 TaxID=3156612 RepID=UPI0032B46CC5